LTLRHDVTSRESYMPGVLLSIREVIKRSGLTYGLESIFGLF
ncbi:MAG: 4-hydroxy-tetrahydrodipicolinate reductase, partial [Candidatus Riflemargulisbacteria bacterium]